MKNKFHVVVIVCVLAVALGVVAFAARSSRGQSSRSNRNASVKPAVRVTESSATKASAFTAAAGQNAVIRNELSWTFGGKEQRGWYLYDLLISKTLDTNDDPVTADFAEEVAAWKKKRGLLADGVLDEDALMALVSQWQSARLKTRTPAQPDQLVTASPSDFYDPGRAAELRLVERNAYEAYKQMIAAAAADLKLAPTSKYLKIVSSYRSREYQDQLRANSPNSGRAGLAVTARTLPAARLMFMLVAVRSTRRIRIARSRSTLLLTSGSCTTRSASASALTSTSPGTGNTLSRLIHRLRRFL